MSGVDLHAHTTASDGTYAPAELVEEAVRRGLRVLAITDHDSTEGVGPALAAARAHPALEIVPGIEINTEVDGAEVARESATFYVDGEGLRFDEVSSDRPMTLGMNKLVTITVDGQTLDAGKHKIGIGFIVTGMGEMAFDVTDAIV